MPDLEADLADLAPSVDTAAGLAALRGARTHRTRRRRIGMGVGGALLIVAGIGLWSTVTDDGEPTRVGEVAAPVLEDEVGPEEPPPPPPEVSSCDISSFAGVRTDSRAWAAVGSDSVGYTLIPSEPCELEIPVVTQVFHDGTRVALPVSPDEDGSVSFPHTLDSQHPVEVTVFGGRCGDMSTLASGVEIAIGEFTAVSAPGQAGWCATGVTLAVSDGRPATAPLASIPTCDGADGLVDQGPLDFAGTLNTTIANEGLTACRIDSVEVVGLPAEDGQPTALAEVVDPPSGIPVSVLPVVVDPGHAIAVMVVNPGRSCPEDELAVVAVDFVVTVEGVESELEGEWLYQLCATDYTTTLLRNSWVIVAPDRFVDLDGRVCLLSNPAQCEPFPVPANPDF